MYTDVCLFSSISTCSLQNGATTPTIVLQATSSSFAPLTAICPPWSQLIFCIFLRQGRSKQTKLRKVFCTSLLKLSAPDVRCMQQQTWRPRRSLRWLPETVTDTDVCPFSSVSTCSWQIDTTTLVVGQTLPYLPEAQADKELDLVVQPDQAMLDPLLFKRHSSTASARSASSVAFGALSHPVGCLPSHPHQRGRKRHFVYPFGGPGQILAARLT